MPARTLPHVQMQDDGIKACQTVLARVQSLTVGAFFFVKKLLQGLWIINILCIFVTSRRKKEVLNEMSYKDGLIKQISNLLLLIETPANQSIIRQIEGLLNALRDPD